MAREIISTRDTQPSQIRTEEFFARGVMEVGKFSTHSAGDDIAAEVDAYSIAKDDSNGDTKRQTRGCK